MRILMLGFMVPWKLSMEGELRLNYVILEAGIDCDDL